MNKVMKAMATIMLTVAVLCAAGCKKETDDGTFKGHDYVDLGLPSGTLWATCNVGADTPEGYGDYFAWGETQVKYNYDWSTYRYGSWNHLIKYCCSPDYGHNGFTDNLTTLQPMDDAARSNWGRGWRMPTDADWMELFQNTTNTRTTQNGVKGCLFTAANGASLFLPANGYRRDRNIYAAGVCGYYWSRSLDSDFQNSAWQFYLFLNGCNMINSTRDIGSSVRPIREN